LSDLTGMNLVSSFPGMRESAKSSHTRRMPAVAAITLSESLNPGSRMSIVASSALDGPRGAGRCPPGFLSAVSMPKNALKSFGNQTEIAEIVI